MTRILAFAGSAKKKSIHNRLIRYGASKAESLGAEVTVVDLVEFPMPLFNEDLIASDGVPETVRGFRKLMLAHDGFLIGCPEYNSSITPLLKNVIDWASVPDGDDAGLCAYQGKVAGLFAASGGAVGGLRGLDHVREILSNIGTHVIPVQAAIGNFNSVFDDDAGISNERTSQIFDSMIELLVRTSERLRG